MTMISKIRAGAIAALALMMAAVPVALYAQSNAGPTISPTISPGTGAQWVVTPARSSLRFDTNWAGQHVSGQFGRWTADIRMNPENPAGGTIIAQIQTGSARANLAEANDNLPLPDWLSSRAFPNAIFQSNRITKLAGNNYRADGTLIIKGVRLNLSLPFSLAVNGRTGRANGAVSLDRLAMNIGKDSDGSAEWVDRRVQVTLSLEAQRR